MLMRWVGVLMVATACGGSSNPASDAGADGAVIIDADEGVGFRVTVDVIGVRDPMTVTLLDTVDQSTQSIVVAEDGTAYRFPRRLPDQHAFTITVGSAQNCMFAPSGTIAGADASTSMTCDGVIDVRTITAMEVDAPLRFQPRFDPLVDVYPAVFAPFLLDPGSTTTIAGTSPYASVSISPQPTITWPASGTVTFTATTSHAPFGPRGYQMTLSRKLLEEGFGKAATPTLNDLLGGADFVNGIGGGGVAISNDTVVVGTPGIRIGLTPKGPGGAIVFRRNGLHWNREATLPPVVASANFGEAVAIAGNTIVVGAPKDGAHGAAYVYTRSGTTWSLKSTLRPTLTSTLFEGALFGGAVAIAGSFLVVGALNFGSATTNGDQPGAVFLFHDDGVAGWNEVTPSPLVVGSTSTSRLGAAVAITANRLAIGVPGTAPNTVQLFQFNNGTGAWQFDELISSPAAGPNRFGEAVALSGDLLVVGAAFEDRPGFFNDGAAYVFHRTATWGAATATLRAPVAQSAALFGFSVGIAGHHVVVGAPFQDGTFGSEGKVHYFRCTAAGVCPATPEVQQDGSSKSLGANLGTSVAIDGLTFVATAPNEDSIATDSGALYIYR